MNVSANKTDKRKALRELSNKAKERISDDCEGMSVNEVLIEEFYTDEIHQTFKTFHDWKKEGFKVNKGEKAFLIWGKPRIIENKKNPTPKNKTEEEKEDEFFPICFLFSNAQVSKKDA